MFPTPIFPKDDDKDRDSELENSIGNLLVAEFQVKKLRDRVRTYNLSTGDKKTSEYMYKVGDDWVRIIISAEKYSPPKPSGESGEEEDDESFMSTGYAP